MKTNKIIITILMAVLPLIGFSQSIFEKYEDLDDVTTIVVSKHAFKLMESIGGDTDEAKELRETVQNLDKLAVYSTSDVTIAAQMKADVKKFLKSSNLSELMRIKDKSTNVKIYVREGRDDTHIKELFMVIDNLKNVNINGNKPSIAIVSLTGDIDLAKIGDVADKLNIPGGEHLKNKK